MRRRKAQLEVWFELIVCTVEAFTMDVDSFVQASKGYFPTKARAHHEARKCEYGSELSSQEHDAFTKGIGRGGYYFIERLVVLEPGRKTIGRIVSPDFVRLGAKK